MMRLPDRGYSRGFGFKAGLAAAVLAVPLVVTPPQAQACDSCAAAALVPITTGLAVMDISATTAALVSAIGLAGGGMAGAVEGSTVATFESMKGAAGMITTAVMQASSRETAVLSYVNTQSLNCRLGGANRLGPGTESVRRAASSNLERSVVDSVFFNPSLTRPRIAAEFLSRLCKNGQLTPEDFGQQWFDANDCITDPTTAHAFLKVSTILDSPVLIPPTIDQMRKLDDPTAHSRADMQLVWDSLNDKQKRYVSAQRYCENLVVSRVQPQNIRNNAAMTISNMETINRNMSATTSLVSLFNMCADEMGRRVALDVSAPGMPAGGFRDELADIGPRILNLYVNKRGADPRAFYAYASHADYVANTPIMEGGKPKAWVSDYVRDYMDVAQGRSQKCAGYANGGSEAESTGTFLECNILAAMWDKKEAAMRKTFIEAVAAINQTADFAGGTAAAVKRINHESDGSGRPPVRDAALDVPGMDLEPMSLKDMLQTMNAAQYPEKTAAAADAQ